MVLVTMSTLSMVLVTICCCVDRRAMVLVTKSILLLCLTGGCVDYGIGDDEYSVVVLTGGLWYW